MAIVLPVIAEKMHKPRVPVEEAVERCVIAKKYKIKIVERMARLARPLGVELFGRAADTETPMEFAAP